MPGCIVEKKWWMFTFLPPTDVSGNVARIFSCQRLATVPYSTTSHHSPGSKHVLCQYCTEASPLFLLNGRSRISFTCFFRPWVNRKFCFSDHQGNSARRNPYNHSVYLVNVELQHSLSRIIIHLNFMVKLILHSSVIEPISPLFCFNCFRRVNKKKSFFFLKRSLKRREKVGV